MRQSGTGIGIAAWSAAILLFLQAIPASAQPVEPAYPTRLEYADLADLADSSQVVLRAQIRKIVRVEDARAPGLRPGEGRFYVQATTLALLSGTSPVGESLVYLVDLPLDPSGKPPRLRKQNVLLFAHTVPGRPGELRLTARNSQFLWDEPTELALRGILGELVSADAPARITGVREIIHVPGALAGEGETQIFLSSADRSAASITVLHRPGMRPAWGVSFSELVADTSHPPTRNTLAWYRLACALPNALPRGTNLSVSYAAQRQAEADYRMVLGELGICRRKLG